MKRLEAVLKIQDETKKLNLSEQHTEQVRDITLILAMLVESPLDLYEICLNVLAKITIIDSAEKDLVDYVQGIRNNMETQRSNIKKEME